MRALPWAIVVCVACGETSTADVAEPFVPNAAGASGDLSGTQAPAMSGRGNIGGAAPGADSPALTVEPNDDAAFLFDQSVLRTFELRLDPEDLAFLDADPVVEQYVPGTLVYEGVEYGPVGVRYKGSLGAWIFCVEYSSPESPFTVGGPKTCPKLNIKVSFNWSDPEGRFFGLKKLQFHAMNNDASLMRERLGYHLFRRMGVPAPRAVHARLLINGQFSGLYINVEDIDGRFTRSRFNDGEGNLYKEVWPTFSENQRPTDENRLLQGLKTNEDENPVVSRVIDFGNAVMNTHGADRSAIIAEWMDVDVTMAMVAVDRAIRADDGLFHFYCPQCANHNYYIYEEAMANRLWIIPWDLDAAFVVVREMSLNADTYLWIMDEWNDQDAACEPKSGLIVETPLQLPPSCDPLIRGWGSFNQEYESAVAQLLAGPFSERAVEESLVAWQTQVSGAVSEAFASDPLQLSPEDWQAGLLEFRERIDLLRAAASAP